MKNLLIALTTTLALFSACTKETIDTTTTKEITVSGRILDKVENKGVPNKTIVIKKPKKDPYDFSVETEQGRTITDKNGNYSINVKVPTGAEGATLIEELVNDSDDYIYPSDARSFFIANGNVTKNYDLYATTQLKVTVKGLEKEKLQGFKIDFLYDNGLQLNFVQVIEQEAKAIKSPVLDTKTLYNTYTKIKWTKVVSYEKNIYTEGVDSILCKKGVLNTFQLNF